MSTVCLINSPELLNWLSGILLTLQSQFLKYPSTLVVPGRFEASLVCLFKAHSMHYRSTMLFYDEDTKMLYACVKVKHSYLVLMISLFCQLL